MELVSVIITTCKRDVNILKRAVNSVLAQTYREIELIIVDDSPNSFEERKKIEEFVQSIRGVTYIKNTKQMGACYSRNIGLKLSKGKYIAFLDDDDEWLSEKIEKQVHTIEDQKTALVYCGNYTKDDVTGIKTIRQREYYSGNIYKHLIIDNFIGSTSFPLINRACLEDIGGFDEMLESAQDYDVWLRLAEKYEITYVQEPLAVYHVHIGEQITRNPYRKISGLERINEKNKTYLDSNKRARWIRNMKVAPFYALKGDFKHAVRIINRYMWLEPFEVQANFNIIRDTIINNKIAKKRDSK